MRPAIAVLAAVSLLSVPSAGAGPAPGPRPGARHAVPLYGTLLRVFDAPDDPYAPGHRGVDVGAGRGTPVHASARGTVAFAGTVAGNRTVTVDHGQGLLTTYSFLEATAVTKGQAVERGDAIGTVGPGHAGEGLPPHVHLSARIDGAYVDPLGLYLGDDHSDLLALVG